MCTYSQLKKIQKKIVQPPYVPKWYASSAEKISQNVLKMEA